MPNAITVQNLTKRYKLYHQPIDRLKEALHPLKKSYHHDFLANNGISFEIKKGEVVGIIGKNGSGKSTLLKMITGVLTPTSGTIEVHGKITAMLELGAGFNPELSGMENLYMSGAISGYTKEQMEAKIDAIVEFADIGEFIHQPLKTYSSGMKARLGFAFSINIEPEILIIDEALSVGDVAFQRKCYAKIEDMCKNDAVTVLFVSHSGSVIKQLCSRAIMIHSGQKVIEGNPKDVVNLYEKFGDSKNLNLDTIRDEYNKLISQSPTVEKKEVSRSFYNPNLISKSKVEFEENGARIFDIEIVDLENNRVNVLENGKFYQYSYKIKYFDSFENVKIAMQIKNISGLNLGGKVVPLKDWNISKVNKNEVFLVRWKFKNILNAGVYLLNCGTNNTEFGHKEVLHRVVDAYMFNVIQDNHYPNGFIDFDFELSIEEFRVELT